MACYLERHLDVEKNDHAAGDPRLALGYSKKMTIAP